VSAELPDVLTPITKEDLLRALWGAYQTYFGSTPKRESVWVLASQVQLETGLRYCHNHNLGNVKSRDGDGHDYQFYACNEILPLKQALAFAKADPEHAKITRTRDDGKAVIWFYPKHPQCRFRAFGSLLEGVTDHLGLLARRFEKAWPAVVAGDMRAFVQKLHEQNYFTADLNGYTKTALDIYRGYEKLPFDYGSLPMLTDQEKAELDGAVALSLANLTDELAK